MSIITTDFNVLVCGGRTYADKHKVYQVLDKILKAAETEDRELCIVHGNAKGADYLADCWAKERRVPTKVFPADWQKHGRAAGPIRNRQMLDEAKPKLVVAFPGSNGTKHMCDISRKAGVVVYQIVE